jgi:hypothetical protein
MGSFKEKTIMGEKIIYFSYLRCWEQKQDRQNRLTSSCISGTMVEQNLALIFAVLGNFGVIILPTMFDENLTMFNEFLTMFDETLTKILLASVVILNVNFFPALLLA